MEAQEILVIILSSFLALFLLLGIILLVFCIKIANHIKHISEKAEEIVDKAEDVADFFSKAATPMAMAKVISNVSDLFRGKGKGRR
jgi:ATP/ADP translocase